MGKIALVNLDIVVERVLTLLPQHKNTATLIALSGELGAGKTTFTQALGRRLGIIETMQSPTYVLMKTYPISYSAYTMFIHIDAYRLENPEEFKTLSPAEFLAKPQNLICLEWPERVEDMIPVPDIKINFSSDGASEGERYIEVV